MFSRGFGNKDTPTTFAQCEALWGRNANKVKRRGSLTLGHNTELHRAVDQSHFYVVFHGNIIVHYWPTFKKVNACGWEDSPTTQNRLTALTGARFCNNSSLGFNQKVRVNGYPYFDGIRIDNEGHVVENDRHSDFKDVINKEFAKRFARTMRYLRRALQGRWELGEFPRLIEEAYENIRVGKGSNQKWVSQPSDSAIFAALDEAYVYSLDKELYLPQDLAMTLLMNNGLWLHGPFDQRMDSLKKIYRERYARLHNAIETMEIKNV